MNQLNAAHIALFIFFLIAHAAWLHRVPGLIGDEASEGENVYQILQSHTLVLQGERSYIGPLIDYLRVPFIFVFGYTALGLRAAVLVFALATYWLAAVVLRKMFGDWPSLFGLVGLFFSPVYLTQQRLGWAITLIPFFALLILYISQSHGRNKWLLAGLAAGVGLSNHILFLPTLAGIAAASSVYGIDFFLKQLMSRKREVGRALSLWPLIVGFWAGFSLQFIVLMLFKEDQGDLTAVAKMLGQRLHDFWPALPVYLSGSSYVASFTGIEFSPVLISLLTGIIILLLLVGTIINWRSIIWWAWWLGLAVQVAVLLYMIDRFSLRYFVIPALAMWLLAGVSLGSLLETIFVKRVHLKFASAMVLAAVFAGWTANSTLIPFLRTGGSTAEFSLGNRTNSAADFVDVRPLVECLRGRGPVYSEDLHIWNRLQYLSHQYPDLVVMDEKSRGKAMWLVGYRKGNVDEVDAVAVCRELQHFEVRDAAKKRA